VNKPIAESQLTLAGKRLAHLMTTIFPNTPVLAEPEQIFHSQTQEVHVERPDAIPTLEMIQNTITQTKQNILEKAQGVQKEVKSVINKFKSFLN